MAPLNNVTFNLGQGGLGRPLPGEDHISGLLFFSNTLPSGFNANNRVKQFFSVSDAAAAGIDNSYSDETKATATYLVTAPGTNGDTATFKVNEPGSKTVTLGVYTKSAAETTAALVATAIAGVINSGSNTHGYTASVASATVTITARPGLGIYLNTGTPLSVTLSAAATLAGTLTPFTGGAASITAAFYYHISEFFRLQPQGVLFVGIFPVPGGSYTFGEIATIQNFANGKIRQIGVYKDGASFAIADITAIHGVCASLSTEHKEIVALYAAHMASGFDLATLPDLTTITGNLCSAVISQDGGNVGATLYAASGKSITTLGAALGAVAKAKVCHSIAWVAQFNISDGKECDILAFANGLLFSNPTVSDNYLSVLQNKRYIFLRKFVGVAGSYFNENSASISLTSDYAYIADNRTMQKATRGMYTNLVPALNSPITLNADGTLSDQAIAYFTGLAEAPLIQMIRDAELSGQAVSIDSTQNVLATGILYISASLVQVATARNIVVNIGYRVAV